MRATSRITGVSRNAINKLLLDTGYACSSFQDRSMRNLPCRLIQVDEVWSFIYTKARRLSRAQKPPPFAGDLWTWVAICADSRLVPTWCLGDRSAASATVFIADLRSRLSRRVQLTSDGHKPYLAAVEETFGTEIDYGMLVKEYGGNGSDGNSERERRSRYTGAHREVIMGNPDPGAISTSYIERMNLTLRMGTRRMTRSTNAHSKRVLQHACAVALLLFYYNFIRPHESLREPFRERTPAMAVGLTNRPWEFADILNLADSAAPKPKRPARYRTRKVRGRGSRARRTVQSPTRQAPV